MAGRLTCTRGTSPLISFFLATSVLLVAIALLDQPARARAASDIGSANAPLGQPAGIAAAAQTVNESALLHQVSKHGTQREEQGQGNGTFRCPLIIRFTTNVTQASVMFTVKTSSGTIYGRGTPSYHVEGSTAYIKGALSVTQGTGRYAHASGSQLQLRATLNRHNYALAVAVTGAVSL